MRTLELVQLTLHTKYYTMRACVLVVDVEVRGVLAVHTEKLDARSSLVNQPLLTLTLGGDGLRA